MLYGYRLETLDFNLEFVFRNWNSVSPWSMHQGLRAYALHRVPLPILLPHLAQRGSQLPTPLLSGTLGTPTSPSASPPCNCCSPLLHWGPEQEEDQDMCT